MTLQNMLEDQKYTKLANSIIISDTTMISFDSANINMNDEKEIDYSFIFSTLATSLASIVDDAIDQLYILGAGLVPQTSIRIENIEDRALQYVADDPIFDNETGDPFDVSFNKKKLLKLYFDSSKIAELLVQIRNELKYNKEFISLTNFIKEVKNSKVQEVELFTEEKSNLDAMNTLKQTLLTEQRDSQNHIHELNEQIAILKDQSEDVLFGNLLRTRYIDNWEKARVEQNQLICFQTENELENTISTYKNEIEKEIRVNNEIEMWIMENQKDMEDDIDDWLLKYDKDSESRTVEIQVLKETREELAVTYQKLKELYDLHQTQIEEYTAYKERKRIEDERIALENSKATKIQAWWRGLMVRLQLGPFNPNKKKGKKGKGKDKKGKDKKGKDTKGKGKKK